MSVGVTSDSSGGDRMEGKETSMGLDECLHLGPFFECRNRRSDKRDVERGCCNPQCRQYHVAVHYEGADFCARCGHQLGEWEAGELLWELGWCEVSEAVDEALALAGRCDDDESVMRWIPNVRRDGAPARDLGERGDTIAVTEFDPEAEKAWLEAAFAAELEILRRLFGEDCVSVGWGFLRWWM